MSKYIDKVHCFDCGETLLRKNLKQHYLRNHGNKPIKFKSATCKALSDFIESNKRPRLEDPQSQIEVSSNVNDELSCEVQLPHKSSVDAVATEPTTELLQELLKKVNGK